MNNNQNFLPWNLSWLTIILALLAIGTFIAVSGPDTQYVTPMGMRGGAESSGGGAVSPMAGGVQMMDTGVSNAPVKGMMSPDYYPYPYPNPDVPITDTREFLKIYYSASMRTRDVPALTRRVETTVRGYDGRIDQESSSPKYGYVSFALPQAKYDAFRAELESLVGSRFININISSQNLLSQKVSIEEQQKQADKTLADYKAVRQKIVNAHASIVESLQAKIDSESTTDSERTLLKQQLASENALYTAQLRDADANIKYAQDWVKAVQTQDKTLLANVATVTGTVSIQWISLWNTALLYLPGYWIPFIFAVLTLLSYTRDRRRSIAVII
jgi:hypothetical protein